MSVQAISWVIENAPVKESELVCLLMIANHAHSDGTGSYPSTATLAKECRISQRHIISLLHSLERKKLITIERGAGPQGVHLYSVSMGGEIISPLKSATSIRGGGGEVYDIEGVKFHSSKPLLRTVIKKYRTVIKKPPIIPLKRGIGGRSSKKRRPEETDWDRYLEKVNARMGHE